MICWPATVATTVVGDGGVGAWFTAGSCDDAADEASWAFEAIGRLHSVSATSARTSHLRKAGSRAGKM